MYMVMQFVNVGDCLDYWQFIRNLRNNPKCLDGFVNRTPITKQAQIKYMQQHCQDYYICLMNGDPVGFIGSIDNDIRVATLPEAQGLGVASFMIKQLIKIYPNRYAKMKIQNERSIKLFQKAGFKRKYYIYEYNKP